MIFASRQEGAGQAELAWRESGLILGVGLAVALGEAEAEAEAVAVGAWVAVGEPPAIPLGPALTLGEPPAIPLGPALDPEFSPGTNPPRTAAPPMAAIRTAPPRIIGIGMRLLRAGAESGAANGATG